MVGVPLIVPDDWLMLRPTGRPLAEYERVAPDAESLAAMDNGLMAAPETLFWFPGLVTVTVLVIVQLNEAELLKPALSVAVTVTE